jgi:hypothetical protein
MEVVTMNAKPNTSTLMNFLNAFGIALLLWGAVLLAAAKLGVI